MSGAPERGMVNRPLPHQSILSHLLRYESKSGKLFWNERPDSAFVGDTKRSARAKANNWNAKNAGKEALASLCTSGYKRGKVLGGPALAHRIIYQMHYGYCPEVLDHINGDKLDNRIENLRAASPADNSRNYAKPCGRSSRYRGVTKTSKAATWAAAISCSVSKKKLHIGCFASEIDAARAYDRAAIQRHGEFATLNFPSQFQEAKP